MVKAPAQKEVQKRKGERGLQPPQPPLRCTRSDPSSSRLSPTQMKHYSSNPSTPLQRYSNSHSKYSLTTATASIHSQQPQQISTHNSHSKYPLTTATAPPSAATIHVHSDGPMTQLTQRTQPIQQPLQLTTSQVSPLVVQTQQHTPCLATLSTPTGPRPRMTPCTWRRCRHCKTGCVAAAAAAVAAATLTVT